MSLCIKCMSRDTTGDVCENCFEKMLKEAVDYFKRTNRILKSVKCMRGGVPYIRRSMG